MVYGVVALVAVLVASRWLLQRTRASRLTTVALGASALAAGILVWILPVGRDLDAFHGIAQNTSTAGVGFEGYLAWAAGAAIFAPRALFGHRNPSPAEESAWRSATRNGLLLIAVWAVGSIAMRLTDLVVGIALNYPFSRYDSVVLAAFDLVTAALAIWLRRRLAGISARLVTSLCGLVAALSVARVIVGVALAPRFADSPNSPARQPVYGNDLAQQITSTFDVTLCGLALGILAAAVVAGQLHGRRLARRAARKRAADANAAAPTTRVRVGQAPGRRPRPPPACPPGARRGERPTHRRDPAAGRLASHLSRRRLRHAADTGAGAPDLPPAANVGVHRRGANANSRNPSPGKTAARNPSTSAARAGSATMWRTSPLRYWPVTSGDSEPPRASHSAAATSKIEIGCPEQTLAARKPSSCASAATLAAATSSTCTKSRIWPPSSKTLGGSPFSSEDRKIAATPEYGVSRGMPGP
ncbi:putative membrane protein [Mycobacterium intracellulare]|nr:putative membrane protein [Mycobacterium intracellulare]